MKAKPYVEVLFKPSTKPKPYAGPQFKPSTKRQQRVLRQAREMLDCGMLRGDDNAISAALIVMRKVLKARERRRR